MKRKLSVLLAALLVLSFAGQAAAYFEDLHLIRSIYNTSGAVEVGTDLGLDVSTFSLANPVNQQRNPDIAASLFDGGLGGLVAGYWAHDLANRDFYATGAYMDEDGLTMLGRKTDTANATYNATQDLYAGIGAATAVFADKTTLGTYFNRFDVNVASSGKMGNNLKNDSFEMDISLADLLSVGYVDQYLYKFDYDGSAVDKLGVEVAVIRTFLTSDGSTIDLAGDMIATVINPSAVPVPAAVWLLGTGIVGLVGIRRRKN